MSAPAILAVRINRTMAEQGLPQYDEVTFESVVQKAVQVVIQKLGEFEALTWASYWHSYKRHPLPDFSGEIIHVRLVVTVAQSLEIHSRARVWCCTVDHLVNWIVWHVMLHDEEASLS